MDVISIKNPLLLTSVHKKVVDAGWNATQARLGERAIEMLGKQILVTEVTTAHIDALKEKLKEADLTDASINRFLTAVSKMCKYAYRRYETYHMTSMPYFEYIPLDNERERYLSQKEEEKLIEVCKSLHDMETYRDFFLFLLDTGMRKGEALGFKVKQVHEHKNEEGRTRLYVRLAGNTTTKKHKRVVPLTPRARAIVEPLMAKLTDEDVVFDLNYWTVQNRFNDVRTEMGLEDDKEFVIHCLRHTCATRLAQSGKVELHMIGQMLGHKSWKMIKRYSHLIPNNLMGAVNVLNQINNQGDK